MGFPFRRFKGGTKFGNKRTEVEGKKFHSRSEAARYCQLIQLQHEGVISGLMTQVPFKLCCGDVKYISDFRYEHRLGVVVIEDVKGFRTPEYIIKRKMMWREHAISIVELNVRQPAKIIAEYEEWKQNGRPRVRATVGRDGRTQGWIGAGKTLCTGGGVGLPEGLQIVPMPVKAKAKRKGES